MNTKSNSRIATAVAQAEAPNDMQTLERQARYARTIVLAELIATGVIAIGAALRGRNPFRTADRRAFS